MPLSVDGIGTPLFRSQELVRPGSGKTKLTDFDAVESVWVGSPLAVQSRPRLELQLASPQNWFGTRTFARGVEPLLDERFYSKAMWAARLSEAWEDSVEGKGLTVLVLSEPRVKEIIP